MISLENLAFPIKTNACSLFLLPDPCYQILDTRCWLPDSTHQILATISWLPDPCYQILATTRLRDPDYHILVTRSVLPDPGYQILAARSWLPYPGYEIIATSFVIPDFGKDVLPPILMKSLLGFSRWGHRCIKNSFRTVDTCSFWCWWWFILRAILTFTICS